MGIGGGREWRELEFGGREWQWEESKTSFFLILRFGVILRFGGNSKILGLGCSRFHRARGLGSHSKIF